MTGGSSGFHESEETLAPMTRDMHRALVSLMEELEAIDWYQQRIDAAGDSELKEILRHNRDEEKEHAAMVLEVHRSLVMQDGGALFSMRGGDFIFTVGGDLAVGYRSHDRDALHLFCVETLAPQTLDPDAVCVLEGDRSST